MEEVGWSGDVALRFLPASSSMPGTRHHKWVSSFFLKASLPIRLCRTLLSHPFVSTTKK